jgi:hypothetical protein
MCRDWGTSAIAGSEFNGRIRRPVYFVLPLHHSGNSDIDGLSVFPTVSPVFNPCRNPKEIRCSFNSFPFILGKREREGDVTILFQGNTPSSDPPFNDIRSPVEKRVMQQ